MIWSKKNYSRMDGRIEIVNRMMVRLLRVYNYLASENMGWKPAIFMFLFRLSDV